MQNLRDYRDLAHHLLARIIVFNAKRGGEAGRMTIEDFRRKLTPQTGDFGLTALELKLCER